MSSIQVIVIGGGAAGFFAAINCAQLHSNCSVTLLEKSSKLLSKVRVSGGGRCNVTHACYDSSLLVKNYPRGTKELHHAFNRFSVTDTVHWFKERGVELKTEEDGRMFPASNTSETIVNCLLAEAQKAKVTIKLNVDITEIIKTENNTFVVNATGGGSFECDKLIIATGGNPKDNAYEWIKKLGHTIIKPVPSLFTFNIPNNPITQLMGISVPHAKVKIVETKLETEGPLLITHWGLSGPAILKASAWGARQLNELNYNFTASINWLPRYNEEKLRIAFANQRIELATKTILVNCPFELPKRLWEHFISKVEIADNTRWADLSKKNINQLIAMLISDTYLVKGKTTFKEEFVTCGGISLKDIDVATMQSKIVPHLFFAGEIIDVDGITGGFNFQNAWSTGWIAAKNVIH
jgi:predicted Rossmann fold flavoprotein